MTVHPNDLAWQRGSEAESGLRVRWLGTAGYELTCDGVTLLIDPYLTRTPLGHLLFRPLTPSRQAIRRWIDHADGIVVGHGHFDHLLDVPAIAKLTGARVWGSRATANLLRASGVPESQIEECEGGEAFDLGPFRIELIRSEHSRFALGGRVPFAGDIPVSCEIPLRGHRYRCGQVFGVAITVNGLTLYHMGSANLIDDAITVRDVDVLLMCIAARQVTDRFIPRSIDRLRPKRIVPHHYDNMFRALDKPMSLIPRIEFGRFVDDVGRVDRQIVISTLRPGDSIEL